MFGLQCSSEVGKAVLPPLSYVVLEIGFRTTELYPACYPFSILIHSLAEVSRSTQIRSSLASGCIAEIIRVYSHALQ